MAFLGEVTGTSLLAIPFTAGGTVTPFTVPNNVTNLRFDPYGNNLITAFNNGVAFGIAALTLGGTKTAPTLAAKASFVSPSDLHPSTIAVRSPTSFMCP
jgi:hypothetical protein